MVLSAVVSWEDADRQATSRNESGLQVLKVVAAVQSWEDATANQTSVPYEKQYLVRDSEQPILKQNVGMFKLRNGAEVCFNPHCKVSMQSFVRSSPSEAECGHVQQRRRCAFLLQALRTCFTILDSTFMSEQLNLKWVCSSCTTALRYTFH